MPFQIVRNDITAMHVDAIVNSANPRVKIGYGVDSAIYKKAGWEALMPIIPSGSSATVKVHA